jgi:hypothetical protein
MPEPVERGLTQARTGIDCDVVGLGRALFVQHREGTGPVTI